MVGAGVITCVLAAALGYGFAEIAPDAVLPLGVVLGGFAVIYAFHELEFIRLPVPGRDWQVPAEWVRNGFYRSAVLFGGIVGFGVFTRVPFASFPLLLVWLFISGNVWYGLAVGLVYGATRALSIFSSANCEGPEDIVRLNQRFMAITPWLHEITGFALAFLGSYLLLATALT
jgi:hypothetical protein